jgi:hypothetical protein
MTTPTTTPNPLLNKEGARFCIDTDFILLLIQAYAFCFRRRF